MTKDDWIYIFGIAAFALAMSLLDSPHTMHAPIPLVFVVISLLASAVGGTVANMQKRIHELSAKLAALQRGTDEG